MTFAIQSGNFFFMYHFQTFQTRKVKNPGADIISSFGMGGGNSRGPKGPHNGGSNRKNTPNMIQPETYDLFHFSSFLGDFLFSSFFLSFSSRSFFLPSSLSPLFFPFFLGIGRGDLSPLVNPPLKTPHFKNTDDLAKLVVSIFSPSECESLIVLTESVMKE